MEDKECTSKVKKLIGSFRFRVDGYPNLSTKVGDSIESPEFTLCGHEWQLRIFPGGSLESHRGFVSFYLASKSSKIARASYKLSLLSQVSGGVDEIFTSSGVRIFEAKGVQIDGWGRDKFIPVSSLIDPQLGFLVDDLVVFKVDITVIGDLECISSPSTFHLGEEKKMSLGQSLCFLLNESRLSDVKLVVQDTVFFANKCILSSRSPVFKGMFCDSEMWESESGIITIVDISPAVMKEVLYFIYTDEIQDKVFFENLVEDILICSSKYQVMGLVGICEEIMIPKIELQTVIPLLIFSDIYGAFDLKEKAFQFIGQNASSILDSKDYGLLEGELLHETEFVLELSKRRKGCYKHFSESEKKIGSMCIIM